MKNHLLVIITLLTSLSLAIGQDKLPTATVSDIDGKPIALHDYVADGTPKIISLWATWCGPCRMELSALHKVYPDWKEKYNIEIIAVTVDNGPMLKRAKSMFESNGWDYTFLHDDQKELMKKLGLTGIPYSILVDGDGTIRSVQTGYFPGYEKELEAKIKAL